MHYTEEARHLDCAYRQLHTPSERLNLLDRMAEHVRRYVPDGIDEWTHHLQAQHDTREHAATLVLRYHAQAKEDQDVPPELWHMVLDAYRRLDAEKLKVGAAMLKGRKRGLF